MEYRNISCYDGVYELMLMNHKRHKPKSSRAGCLLCKPHKALGNSKKADCRIKPIGVFLESETGFEYPVYKPSDRTIKAYKQALKDIKAGRFIKIDNIEKFFNEL